MVNHRRADDKPAITKDPAEGKAGHRVGPELARFARCLAELGPPRFEAEPGGFIRALMVLRRDG